MVDDDYYNRLHDASNIVQTASKLPSVVTTNNKTNLVFPVTDPVSYQPIKILHPPSQNLSPYYYYILAFRFHSSFFREEVIPRLFYLESYTPPGNTSIQPPPLFHRKIVLVKFTNNKCVYICICTYICIYIYKHINICSYTMKIVTNKSEQKLFYLLELLVC